jgi:adenosine deaminase
MMRAPEGATRMTDAAANHSIVNLPKVELHLHLETSFRLRRLLEQRDDGPLPLERAHVIADPARFSGYDRLRRLRYAGRSARIADVAYTRDNIASIAAELMREVAGDGIRHVEVRVGGQRAFAMLGVRGVFEAIAEGVAAARTDTSYGAIVTLVRERGPEEAERIVGEAVAAREHGVVGVDLAGDEHQYPAILFRTAIARARDAGLGVTVHAGEFDGPSEIWAAIYQLGATRIGHAISAVADHELMERMRDRQILVEACPTSDIRVGTVPSLAAHPVRALMAAGVPVTVSADDPMLHGTTLSRELGLIAHAQQLDMSALAGMMAAAARAAFLPARSRKSLERQMVPSTPVG